jgi:hypothetical protein
MRKTGGDKHIVRTPCSHHGKPGSHQAPNAILSNNHEEHEAQRLQQRKASVQSPLDTWPNNA